MTSLLTVRKPGRVAKWYVDGQPATQDQYDQARTGKTLDCFVTRIAKDGTVRHWVEAH